MGGRYAHIDAARAIAALLVIWQHCAEMFVVLAPSVRHGWMAEVANAADFGRLGVVLFFAISGYVIPWSLREGEAGAGRTFVIRRVFRLFPAYWLSIPLAVIGVWNVVGQAFPLRDLLLNFTMIAEVLGARPALGLYWTLAYELGFYVLCLGLWRGGLLHRPWTMLILALGAIGLAGALLVASVGLRKSELGAIAVSCLNYGAMFAGACWRRWQDGGYPRPSQRVAGALCLGGWLIALPLGCAAVWLFSGRHNDFFVRVPASYGGALLAFLLLTTVWKISWRPLAWVGLVSYSLYLFHPVVLYPVVQVLRGAAHVDVALLTALTAGLSIGLAAIVYYAVERPGVALGRKLSTPRSRLELKPAQ